MTKDSTEAELIMVERCEEFLDGQGYKLDKPLTLQDNTSTISLVTKGGGSMRNKHLRSKQAWIRERVQKKELEIRYLGTKMMIADALTKPLQGELFRDHARRLLGTASHVHAFLDRGALSGPAGSDPGF